MKTIIFDLPPVAKPRMTRRDVWKKRPVVERYKDWRTAMQLIANTKQYVPAEILEITFDVAMPTSWSKKKRLEMVGTPHRVRPDLDNYIKSFQDSLCKEDSYIWRYRDVKKIWAEKGYIVVYEED